MAKHFLLFSDIIHLQLDSFFPACGCGLNSFGTICIVPKFHFYFHYFLFF